MLFRSKALENIHKILGPEHDEVYRQQQAQQPSVEAEQSAAAEQPTEQTPAA